MFCCIFPSWFDKHKRCTFVLSGRQIHFATCFVDKAILLDKQYWLTHVLFATQVDKTAMKNKANAQQKVWQKTGRRKSLNICNSN